MQNPALWYKILQEGKKKKGYGFKCKEIQGKKLNPNLFSLVFGLGKTPNVDKGVLYWL